MSSCSDWAPTHTLDEKSLFSWGCGSHGLQDSLRKGVRGRILCCKGLSAVWDVSRGSNPTWVVFGDFCLISLCARGE